MGNRHTIAGYIGCFVQTSKFDWMRNGLVYIYINKKNIYMCVCVSMHMMYIQASCGNLGGQFQITGTLENYWMIFAKLAKII